MTARRVAVRAGLVAGVAPSRRFPVMRGGRPSRSSAWQGSPLWRSRSGPAGWAPPGPGARTSAERRAERSALSVGGSSVVVMAEKSSARHLTVVRAARRVEDGGEADRAAYWARVQALRAERERLRAG